MDEQRWYAQRLGRRRRSGELAVHGNDRALAVAEAQAAVGVLQQVFAHLLLEVLARCRRTALESRHDCILCGVEGVIGTLAFGEVEADVWQKLDRGIEQHGPLDAVRCKDSEFESEAAAERVADPLRTANAGGVERLEHIVCMGGEGPGWFPPGVAVSAQVRS